MSHRRRKKNKKGLSIVFFVVVFFCMCIGVQTIALKQESGELAGKQNLLLKKMEKEEKRTKDLEELEKYMQTKKYMEDVAREKLGLVYPDEILIEPNNK